MAAYSLRARTGAPVSWPLAWDELTARVRPAAFTIDDAAPRLRGKKDPWRDYWTTRQRLPSGHAPA